MSVDCRTLVLERRVGVGNVGEDQSGFDSGSDRDVSTLATDVILAIVASSNSISALPHRVGVGIRPDN